MPTYRERAKELVGVPACSSTEDGDVHSVAARVALGPSRAGEPIEDVPAKSVAFGQGRVIEVVAVVVRHAESLHHCNRSHIRGDGERNDLVEPVVIESEGDGSLGALGRKAVTPVCPREPPPDLDAWGEGRGEARNHESDVADERRAARRLDGPET